MDLDKNIYSTVVIGAGLTGLTTAFILAREKADFLVIEKQDRPGGVIKTYREGAFTFESGPNTGIMGQPEVMEILAGLGDAVVPEIANESVKKRWILKNSKWEPLPSGLASAIRTPLFTTGDKLRLLTEPFRPPGRNPDETLSKLVLRRMGKSFLDYAIDPFILGVYSGDPALLITRHAFPKLYRLEQEYGSFIGGSIRKSFKKKTDREKLATREVFSIRGGLDQLTQALFQESGPDHYRFGCNNAMVNRSGSEFLVSYTDTAGELLKVRARQVITTTGANALDQLLPFLTETEKGTYQSIKYAPVVEVVLGFDRWEGIQPAAFGGLIPFAENRNLLGILFLSSFLADRAPAEGALFTAFMGGIRNPRWVNESDQQIRKTLATEFKELMGISRFEPSLFRIFRHPWAIPQYGPESDEKIHVTNTLMNKYPGLIIGGNLKDGIGIADRMKQGKMLAELALK